MFFGIWLKGGAQGWACATGRPPRGDEGPFMPAGSGSRPSSASSGAVDLGWPAGSGSCPSSASLGGGGRGMPAGSMITELRQQQRLKSTANSCCKLQGREISACKTCGANVVTTPHLTTTGTPATTQPPAPPPPRTTTRTSQLIWNLR